MPRNSYHHGDLKNALIQAGAGLLVEKGVKNLSLREVAARAGVSHSAPYAHFADKQALIAAICTEGFRQLYRQLEAATAAHPDDPYAQLLAIGRAYIQFARQQPAFYKLMFSGVIEHEHDYPEFVQITQANFQLLTGLIRRCRAAGLLLQGPEDVLALSILSLAHGFASLLLERQISHTILERYSVETLIQQVQELFLPVGPAE